MSDTVLADAQFSVARVFRPFRGFEEIYNGVSANTPIAIPGDLEPNAGKPGVDSNLISGIPMPLGAKAIVWFPTIFNFDIVSGGFVIQPYWYTILWRLRNIRDFRVTRSSYHFPQQGFGENSQFVIPCATNTVIGEHFFVSTPTDTGSSQFPEIRNALNEVGVEYLNFRSTIVYPPLSPRGGGAIAALQQGLADGAVGSNNAVSFNPVQMDVLGDEMLILVNRSNAVNDVWDFDTPDRGFSSFYGTRNGEREPIDAMGIYVFTGSNP